MQTSDKQIAIIKNHEGFESTPYADPPGQNVTFSIAYGHYMGNNINIFWITELDADTLLRSDLVSVENVINKYLINISQNDFDALADLGYGAGSPKLKNLIVNYIKKSDMPGAINYIANTKFSNVNDRRKADLQQCSDLFNPINLSNVQTEALKNAGIFNPYFIPVFGLGIFGLMKIFKIVK